MQRDVRDLARIGSLDTLPRLLALAAGQTARLINISDLASPFQLSRPTIRGTTVSKPLDPEDNGVVRSRVRSCRCCRQRVSIRCAPRCSTKKAFDAVRFEPIGQQGVEPRTESIEDPVLVVRSVVSVDYRPQGKGRHERLFARRGQRVDC